MKFLADMGISPRSAAFLRSLGHDAIHLHEEGLDRLSDASILSKALDRRARIVLTHDLDFGDLVAASRASSSQRRSHFVCATCRQTTSTATCRSSSPKLSGAPDVPAR